jgi:FAD:protein FMN transferase
MIVSSVLGTLRTSDAGGCLTAARPCRPRSRALAAAPADRRRRCGGGRIVGDLRRRRRQLDSSAPTRANDPGSFHKTRQFDAGAAGRPGAVAERRRSGPVALPHAAVVAAGADRKPAGRRFRRLVRIETSRALGTKVVLAVSQPAALERASRLLAERLDEVDHACSRFRPDSELTRLNAAAGRATAVSPLLYEAVEISVAAAKTTGGLVDPTIGRTLRLSGYDRTFAVVRTRDGSLQPSYVRSPGWNSIELDPARRTVRLVRGVELDLGSTAKALTADRAARAIAAETGSAVLVSLGGDVSVAGEPPAGGWSVRVAEDSAAPTDTDGPAVAIRSGGLATSATTVRRWSTTDGELHHIIDPRTGRPAPPYWRTVTVAASSCLSANTASTAAVVAGEPALAWLSALRVPARLVRHDGAVTCTAGWPGVAA